MQLHAHGHAEAFTRLTLSCFMGARKDVESDASARMRCSYAAQLGDFVD